MIVWPCIVADSSWIKSTDALNSNLYCYYDSTCFGQPFCPSSGVLSRTSALVHFVQFWWPFATRSGIHPDSGSKRSSKLRKMYQSWCKAKNFWWWAERLPETCRVVITIKIGNQCVCWFYSQGWYSLLMGSVYLCIPWYLGLPVATPSLNNRQFQTFRNHALVIH